jgi:hypothetical protein
MYLTSKEQAKELFKLAATKCGNYTKEQLAVFGVSSFLPKKHWLKHLINNWDKITCAQMNEFCLLKKKQNV